MRLAEQFGGKVGIFALLMLAVIVVHSSTANAFSPFDKRDNYAKLAISNGECLPDGSFKIKVENTKNYLLSTNAVDVVVIGSGSNITVLGKWFFVNDKGDEVQRDIIYETYNFFRSSVGSLNVSGAYVISLKYRECESFPDFCEAKFTLQNCPGYKYNCDVSNLRIKKCYARNSSAYNGAVILISGLNDKQYSKINPIDDVGYNIKTNTRVWLANNRLEGLDYTDLGNDTYLVNFPLEPGNKLEQVEAKINNCHKPSYIFNCKEPKCITDSDCLSDEFCDSASKICKSLDCSNCQTISEHRCVEKCKAIDICQQASCSQGTCSYKRIENCCKSDSECSDSLICTTNTCVNNACVNENLECQASSDPCIIGKCEEPVGCKYFPNPECQNTAPDIMGARVSDTNIVDLMSLIGEFKSKTALLSKGDILQLSTFGKNVSIATETVGGDFAELTVGNKKIRLNVAKETKIDLNNDGTPDIGVMLKSVSNGKANLTFTEVTSGRATASLPYLVIGFLALAFLAVFATFFLRTKKSARETVTATTIQGVGLTSEFAIEVTNFSSKQGNSVILDKVSFSIKKGEMVCLVGPSGVGKSTIIEALVGRKTPTGGVIKILGKNIKSQKILDFVGYVPQAPELYANQTVEQNLLSSAIKWNIKDVKAKIDKILSLVDLLDKKGIKANKLSGGQQKLLSLSMELIRDVEICILDEPTSGLDPNTRNKVITTLRNISSQLSKTVFFTTHFMDDAEECDNVIILANKTIAAQGSPSRLKKSLPGSGKIVNIILDNVTDNLLKSINEIPEVKKIVREGRSLKFITENPNAMKLGQKIEELGGAVNEAGIENATIMEVFAYFTGEQPNQNG